MEDDDEVGKPNRLTMIRRERPMMSPIAIWARPVRLPTSSIIVRKYGGIKISRQSRIRKSIRSTSKIDRDGNRKSRTADIYIGDGGGGGGVCVCVG